MSEEASDNDMELTKVEKRNFKDLDSENQVEYIKTEITEFTGRVVVAVGIALGGIWYGSNTKPHTLPTEAGETMQVTTPNIVAATVGLLAISAWVGFRAYKRRERILEALRLIQEDSKDKDSDQCICGAEATYMIEFTDRSEPTCEDCVVGDFKKIKNTPEDEIVSVDRIDGGDGS